MKNLQILLLFVLFSFQSNAQVESKVYAFDKPMAESKGKKVENRMYFIDQSRDFETISMEAILFHKKAKITLLNNLMEQLIIVKEGLLTFTLNDKIQSLGQGSIVLLLPGDQLKIQSFGPASFYLMKYKAKEGQSIQRGQENGGSFMMDWDKIEYKTHDKGGIRNFYNKPTTACKRMEMHVTNLNAGIKSHEPHTHRAAEIVLMIKGKSEMELGDQLYHGQDGDFYYLGSEKPHAIKNIDKEQIQYFAFQFE